MAFKDGEDFNGTGAIGGCLSALPGLKLTMSSSQLRAELRRRVPSAAAEQRPWVGPRVRAILITRAHSLVQSWETLGAFSSGCLTYCSLLREPRACAESSTKGIMASSNELSTSRKPLMELLNRLGGMDIIAFLLPNHC